MKRIAALLSLVLLVLAVSAPVWAVEEAHFEGYTFHSNPNTLGTLLQGRGLVTALYPPLVSNFSANEYTWEVDHLMSQGSVLRDSVYYTVYSVVGSTFSIYDDPSGNARSGFYNCPSTATTASFRDGALYLRGHFVTFATTFDIHADVYGQGTFTGTVNWDSGSHIADLEPGVRGSWQFGGSTTSEYACIPLDYDQQVTGRIFQRPTPAPGTTWGRIRRLYQ